MATYARGESLDDDAVGMGLSSDGRRRTTSHQYTRHDGSMDEAAERLISQTAIPEEDDEELRKAEKKAADRLVLSSLLMNGVFIGLCPFTLFGVRKYNKWMFAPDHLDFHFPLFVTCLHMIVQFTLSSLVLYFVPRFRPAGLFGAPTSTEATPLPGFVPSSGRRRGFMRWNSKAEERRKQEGGQMTTWVYLTKIAPCGAATGLDIGLGNMSLKFITLAFYTMCKSSSLAFVLLFAFAFKLEKVTWKLVGIIGIMTVGVVMMVASEAKFVLVGFLLVITASALSGMRWSLTQMLLLRNPATSNPFSSIFFLAPCMFFSILAIAIPVEGFGPLFERCAELRESHGILQALGILIFPGVIAFLMVSSEFALLQRSSVITLSICGIFKEVMTITAAAVIFKDPLTPVNISGLIVTIISIGCYNYMKVTRMRAEAAGQVHGAHAAATLSTGYAAVGDEEESDREEAEGERDERGPSVDLSAVSNSSGGNLESDIGGSKDVTAEGPRATPGASRAEVGSAAGAGTSAT